MDPTINTIWINFGNHFGYFWSLLRPPLSGPEIAPPRIINESGEKATGAGIIFSKRKGGIYEAFKTL